MFVSRNSISAVLILTHAVSAYKLPSRALENTCFEPGSMSCQDDSYKCDEINGHTYWTVTDTSTELTNCTSKCVAESDLEYVLDGKFACGPCRICPSDMRCKLDDDEIKFTLFRIKSDGKCEEKCEKESKVQEKMDKDGYQCGFCPDPEERSLSIDPSATTPTPDKCTLKRKDRVMRYEPNQPALEPGIIVQVMAVKSGNIYNFTVTDTSVAEFYIADDEAFYDMWDETLDKDDQGVMVRFIGPRGPGGWESCNYSPIGIDLNRDGEVTRILPQDVGRTEGWTIDITGDGEEEYLNEWFGPEDGILVDLAHKYEMFEEEAARRGRRVQELIISGVELLGDQGGQYADGYQKLRNRDADGNGIVQGEELVGLHIWKDFNSNAKLDSNELSNLADHGIVGLRVTHNNLKSTAILANGEEILTEDLWLNR